MACGNLSPSPSFWAAFHSAGKAVFSRTGRGFDMRFFAVLNKDGGTLRNTDLDALRSRMEQTLEAAGHRLDTDIVTGDAMPGALDEAIARRGVDVVLAGGGDGTISAAAARLMGRKKAL